MEYFTQGEF